jgi:ABC-type bacteriocin/lantibiotic exporter with double-glycine peptidase domain
MNLIVTFLKKSKTKTTFLIAIIILNSFVETFSVSVVYPFVKYVVNEESSIGGVLTTFKRIVSFYSAIDPKIILGCIVLIIFLLRSLLASLVVRSTYNFVYLIEEHLSDSVLQNYLNKRYSSSSQISESDLISSCSKAPTVFAHSAVIGVCTLLSEAVLIILFISMAFYLNPIMALSFTLMGLVCGYIFTETYKIRLGHWGEVSVGQNERTVSLLKDVVSSLKAIKISKIEKKIALKHMSFIQTGSAAGQKYLTTQALPRVWMEFLGMATVVICAIYLIAKKVPIVETVPILASIVVIGIRIMPAISRLIGSVTSIRYGMGALRQILRFIGYHSEENSLTHAPASIVPAGNLSNKIVKQLKIESVSFRYYDNQNMVLDDVSAEVKLGEALAIVGQSGVGKSTLIDLIMGLRIPNIGAIKVNGESIFEDSTGWQSKLAYVPQSIYLLDGTIRDNLLFGIDDRPISPDELEYVIQQCGLTEFIQSCPNGLDSQVGDSGMSLSGGQKQRVAIARALLKKAEVLILDEPLSALDPESQMRLVEVLKTLKNGRIIIFVSHHSVLTSICDKLLTLKSRFSN